MRHVLLNHEAINTIAAAQGIDTVSELARRCGLTPSYFGRILQAERPAQPSHVLTLAKALNVKPSELLHESEAALGEAMDAALLNQEAS